MKKNALLINIAIVLSGSFVFSSVFANNEVKNTENKTEGSIELIEVIGSRHKLTSRSVANSDFIELNEINKLSSSVTELLSDLPGIDISGQGGLFQTYSIQGLSGARVQTQLSGIPLHSQRRAGTAASFISPFLIATIEVLKGASSTLYGSGAIGGITQIAPRQFDNLALSTSIHTSDNSTQQDIGWGNESFSLGVSHQQAKNGYTAMGTPLNSHYQQTSASFLSNWQFSNGIKANFLLMPSYGKDIGKANNENFIDKKLTIYPKEQHIISQFSLLGSNWQSNIAVHQQQLDTYVERFNKRSNSINGQATDYSANFSHKWQIGDYAGQWGLDQQHRSNVKVLETEKDIKSNTQRTGLNLLAQQYDSALFSQLSVAIDKIEISAGARLNYVKQESNHSLPNNTFSDHAWTGFSNIAWKLAPNFHFQGSINKGFRFASLSERFYSGTTARGKTLGNVNLAPETATNYQATVRYQQFQFNVFINKISNYIERINIDKKTRSYQNVYQATIKGAEFSFSKQLTNSLSYQLNGDYIVGKNESGVYLAGISANKIQFIANYQENNWHAQLKFKHRFAKNSVAYGEQALTSANVVSARLIIEITNHWRLSFSADNVLNEAYTLTTDKKSAASAERQLGIKLSWQG